MRASLITPSLRQGFYPMVGLPANPNLRNGLVLGFQMGLGPTGGTLYDISGHKHHGPLTNMNPATDWVRAGRLKYALLFNGVDQYVEKDEKLFNNYPFTFCAFVIVDPGEGVQPINITLSTAPDHGMTIDIDILTGFARAWGRNTTFYSATGSTDLQDGQPHLIVGRFFSATFRELWVDGRFIADNTGSVPWDPAINRWSIGRVGDSTPSYYPGRVGAVYAYNRILFPSEIQQMFVDPFAVPRQKAQVISFAPAAGGFVPYPYPRHEMTGGIAV